MFSQDDHAPRTGDTCSSISFSVLELGQVPSTVSSMCVARLPTCMDARLRSSCSYVWSTDWVVSTGPEFGGRATRKVDKIPTALELPFGEETDDR